MRIMRVFPRRTEATPVDDLAHVGDPFLWHEADEVHVSVSFTRDLPEAERLVKAWSPVAPVKIGGPAIGMRGEEFTPGMYLKTGYTITSRGCPNRCWFCSVWRRDGTVRELPIRDGWIVQDDNLLACSRPHIESVFAMLSRQKHRAEFRGGLEAKRVEPWIVEALRRLNPESMFFAYDMPEDEEPAREVARLMLDAGFPAHHRFRIYVLTGYKGDTMDAAERRLRMTWDWGYLPMSMLWRDDHGKADPAWRSFNSAWANPSRIRAMCTQGTKAWAPR